MSSNLDNFDQGMTPAARRSNPNLIWNLLTVIMLLGTLCLCAVFIFLFLNPNSAFNPFPPATAVPPLPTATWTPIGLPATWTPTSTVPPTDSPTPRPSLTLEPSDTPYVVATVTSIFTSTVTVAPSKTPKPTGVPYIPNITYSKSSDTMPNTTCAQLYVVGQILNASNAPVQGITISLGGSLPGKIFYPPTLTYSGLSQTYFGPSGFEFDLGVQPVASINTLWIQLSDQNSAPISDKVSLTTYNDCNKNLIFIHFKEK